MFFLKINGLVLAKEKIKENDAVFYILTKNYGMLKCYVKGIFRAQSKNLGLLQLGNYNRFFLLSDGQKFKLLSALPLKIVTKVFFQEPYRYLWVLKLVKNLKLLETPKFLWFILLNLEKYLQQSPKNFPFWFLFHLFKELGYELNLETCQNCGRKLKSFAFFDHQRFLYCFYCRQKSFSKINKEELNKARKIKSFLKIPPEIPSFLKIALKNLINDLSVIK